MVKLKRYFTPTPLRELPLPHFPRRAAIALLAMALSACAATPRSVNGSADPNTVAGDYLQGRFAASQNVFDKAADSFGRAAGAAPSKTVDASAFRYALAAGDLSAATTFATSLVETPTQTVTHAEIESPNFMDADLPQLTLVAADIANNDFAAAATRLEAQMQTSLGESIAHLLKGWAIYVAEGEGPAADAVLDVPDDVFAGFAALHVGLMSDLGGDKLFAERAYGEALAGTARDMAVIAFAGFQEREGDRDAALDLYRKLSEDRGFLRRVGRMGLARLGEPLEGESKAFLKVANSAQLRLVDTPQQGAAIVFLNFAWSAYEQAVARQAAAARAGFDHLTLNLQIPLNLAQLAISIDPELDAGHYLVGAVATYYDRYEVAARANANVTPRSWLYNYAAIDRAEAFVQMGSIDQAIKMIQNYLRQDHLAPDVEATLAELLAEQKRHDEAIEAASRAINIANILSSDETRGENLWRYYFVRGAIRADADAWELAEQDLRGALELAPNEPLVLNYLGYSYVERGENLDEAFDMIERALAERPSSGAITDSLGWAHYQLGNYEKAVEYLERAVSLEPSDDVITDHLGDAYWQLGRKTEARYEWRRVLTFDFVDDEVRARVEAKLAGTEQPAPGTLVARTADPVR